MLRVSGCLCFALMGALVKLGSLAGGGLAEIISLRMGIGALVVLTVAVPRSGWGALRANSPQALLRRNLIGAVAMFATFEALILLPLAEATTIGFMGPIFATLLSWLFLKEPVGRHRWLAALIAFGGVVVVMRPGASAEHAIPLLGVLVALISAFGQATVTVTLRSMAASENPAAIAFWFQAGSASLGLMLLPFIGTGAGAEAILLLAGAGIAGGLGQLAMTGSLREAPVSVLAPFDYVQLIGAVLLGWLLVGTTPTLNTWAGATLIAGSGLYTVWREHRRRRDRAVPATQTLG
jgi:drug/metabolite transporter (DMT)-like permease